MIHFCSFVPDALPCQFFPLAQLPKLPFHCAQRTVSLPVQTFDCRLSLPESSVVPPFRILFFVVGCYFPAYPCPGLTAGNHIRYTPDHIKRWPLTSESPPYPSITWITGHVTSCPTHVLIAFPWDWCVSVPP